MPNCKILVWSRADITTVKSIAQNFNTCFLDKHSMASPVILHGMNSRICAKYAVGMWSKQFLDHILTRLIATRCKQPWISPYIRWLSHRKQCMYKSARSLQSPFYWQKYQLFKKRFKKNVVRLTQTMCQLQWMIMVMSIKNCGLSLKPRGRIMCCCST